MLFALCFFSLVAREAPAAGLNVQNSKPALDASGGGVLLDATPIGHLMYRLNYEFSYARSPLEYGWNGKRSLGVVDNLFYNDLTAGFGLTPSLDAGLSVPYGIVYDYLQTGTDARKTVGGVGDVRLGLRDTLFDRKDVPIRLALAASANFPSGYQSGYLGSGTFEGDLRAISEARAGTYRFIVNLGYLVRGPERMVNVKLDDQIFWGIGSRSSYYDNRLGVEAEIFGSTGAAQPFRDKVLNPIEGDLGVRVAITRGWSVKLGGGGGLTHGIGSPQFRILAGVQYAYPGLRDRDGDGIPDKFDKCPNDPEDIDGFQDNDGCPDPDNDNDGIPDRNDKCPNDPENVNGWQDKDGCPDPEPNAKLIGHVVGEDGKPISALVKLDPSPDSQIRSDANGHFEVNLPFGDYKILLLASGYETVRYKITLKDREVKTLRFVMKESMFLR
ncbi:MAG: carboxypeptidase regulatory-like domain-containing protein [bacterium]|nr:carboxypeptidase regulatory-like domain-containing protein [bacterium]